MLDRKIDWMALTGVLPGPGPVDVAALEPNAFSVNQFGIQCRRYALYIRLDEHEGRFRRHRYEGGVARLQLLRAYAAERLGAAGRRPHQQARLCRW